MAVAASEPIKDHGDKFETVARGNGDGRDGLVAAHLRRMVRGAETMDSDQDGAPSQRDNGRYQRKR